MTEKWLQGSKMPFNKPKTKLKRAQYGMPIQMFKDSDKDGVMNVFDCKPFNKRKQDVIRPQNLGGVDNMWQRIEQDRLNKLYLEQQRQQQAIDAAKLDELQRLSNVQVIDNSQVIYKDVQYVVDPDTGKSYGVDTTKGMQILKDMTKANQQMVNPSTSSRTYSVGGKTYSNTYNTSKPAINFFAPSPTPPKTSSNTLMKVAEKTYLGAAGNKIAASILTSSKAALNLFKSKK